MYTWYIRQPQGYEDGTDRVCKLVKSMYGLSKSPRDWFDCFDEFVTRLGFMKNNIDLCLYVHGEGENTLYLVNYVDDVLLCCKNKNKIEKVKNLLSDRFKMKDLGEIKEYLGIKIEYDYGNNKMELIQTAYIESLVEKYKLQNSNLYNAPMETKLKNLTIVKEILSTEICWVRYYTLVLILDQTLVIALIT